MPNIVEYNSTSNLTPSDKGIQAAEQAARVYAEAGRSLDHTFSQLGDQVEKHMAVMETSELYKTGTELRLNLQQRYEKESALPENRNDPHFGDRFMAEVGPQLDQWGAGANTEHGKMLAATLKASIRNEVFNHVASGQAAMDTAHVEDNLTQTINTLGAGLMMEPSEANLHRTLGAAKDAIQGMTMAIPDVETRERVAAQLTAERLPQLVAARYQGIAESIKDQVAQTGDVAGSPAAKQLDQDVANQVGFQYLPPEAQSKIAGLRDTAIRQGRELYLSNDALQRRQQDEAVGDALVQVNGSLYKPNGAGGVTMTPSPQALDAVNRIAQMPGAGRHASEIDSLRNVLHTATQDQLTGKERVSDQGVYNSLFAKIGSTADPLTKVQVDQQVDRLSKDDFAFLRGSAADNKAANPKNNHAMSELNLWLGRIKPMIDKSNIYSGVDQSGAANFSYFAQDATRALRKAIDAGQDPEKAVAGLTDPRNPNGLYAHMSPYMQTNKQGLAGVLHAVQPGAGGTLPPPPGGIRHEPAPALSGESTQDYLKRINH